ncbi:DctP family TRAP transporter solute-binding subunit [Iocasia frigidifontis]|uniref:DctP family TRAP transporter solute-binding subunit n=1 Tax=Iocasia fonsfrigidae TaxID=2682810 RepID=A0A8A7KH38_9FIRM|nr:TRAP transporter substrate-binding protein [Iocasia fonsfrigidae]QTL97192.1 DctP family TRAP transporter solute-binding subunit [Iocasia fonsfrigidae]
MKKVLSLFIVVLMFATVLSVQVFAKDKPSYTFRYAELNPDGHIMDECGDYFAKLVSEKSNGRITIKVFPAGQLGDEKTVYQTLQMGGVIDICRGNTNSLGDFGVKKLTLFGLPFVFRDREHLWDVLNSEIGEEFLREPQEIGTGMVGLFYLDEGSRHFFTAEDIVIDSVDDFEGLKLRVPTTELMTETVGALGVQSTPISFSELYSSLQTGVVDGAEQPFSGYYSNKFYEVAPNYILTGHTYSPSIVLMSEASWNKLDAEDRALIMEAAKETEEWNRQNIERLDKELLEKIKAAGVNVIEVPDKTPYIEATKDVVLKYIAGYEKYYEAIQAK